MRIIHNASIHHSPEQEGLKHMFLNFQKTRDHIIRSIKIKHVNYFISEVNETLSTTLHLVGIHASKIRITNQKFQNLFEITQAQNMVELNALQ